MIRHIFKIIWTERKINVWILLELVLVFSILWFCWGYLFSIGKEYVKPLGVDTNHVYSVQLSIKKDVVDAYRAGDKDVQKNIQAAIWNIYDQIKTYPLLESTTFSAHNWGRYTIDSMQYGIYTYYVHPEYFDLFKIELTEGRLFEENEFPTVNEVVIRGDANNQILHYGVSVSDFSDDKDYLPDLNIKDIKTLTYTENEELFTAKVVGIAPKMKRTQISQYTEAVFFPLRRDNYNLPLYPSIYIRVKPDADQNFISKFKEDMQQALSIYPYSFYDITPFDNGLEFHKNVSQNLKSVYAISLFLIVSIVLGLVGTFWFRIQSRKKDIGLRMSLGASKSSVKSMFIIESVLLLFMASIIATILCINISFIDVFEAFGFDFLSGENRGILTNYFVTFLPLSIITVLSVWYPAKKASKIQPATVLKMDN
ncbi:ABC transporter permease [Bacteroidales bacterium OttesenSCG-928-C19]|nr:ABC transporter permease [Bacteroidales bacterium OttesenSCG-928-C19]